jgi:uncharacterized protein YggE
VATVTVRGEALVPGQPDSAGLWLILQAEGERPELAHDDVAARSETLLSALDGLGVDAAARTTHGITVEQVVEHDERGRRHVRGFRAEMRIAVRIRDSALIGTVLREAVSRVGASVLGPQWRVGLENPARAVARRRAVSDALTRAEAYAGELGLRLGPLVSLVEPRAEGPSRGYGMTMEIPVEAGEFDVYAAVDATFELEPA